MTGKRTQPDHNKLPKYVYIRRGWFVYREYLGNNKVGKDIKLCRETAPLSEVWQRYESLTCAGAPRKSLDWLINSYLTSPQFAQKSANTQHGYRKNAKQLSQTPVKSGGTFGQIEAERITPGVIRKYLDARTAHVAGNRELAFLSVCFSWAVERDLLKTNPCTAVRRNSEKPRTRLVTKAEYQAVFNLAAHWPHVQCAMEFAYLLRMRQCEVLDLKQSDLTDAGIHVRRRKGSRDNITTWTPRLKAAVRLSENLPMPSARPINPTLIRGATGQRLTEYGFQTLWQRLMNKAVEQGIERFTFHDLKAMGISNTDTNKQQASGHKTAAMLAVYDRKLAEVKPSGEK